MTTAAPDAGGTTVPLTQTSAGDSALPPTDPQNPSVADNNTAAETSAVQGDTGTTNGGDQPGDKLISYDTLTDIKAAQGPLQPTALDSQGVERIVGPAIDDNWRPARVDPDPDQIAHLEAVKAAEDERRADRLAATQAAPDNLGEGHGVAKAALEAERA